MCTVLYKQTEVLGEFEHEGFEMSGAFNEELLIYGNKEFKSTSGSEALFNLITLMVTLLKLVTILDYRFVGKNR